MIDAILGASTGIFSSGIARFNDQLAWRLNLPYRSVINPTPRPAHPLISIRTRDLAYWTVIVNSYPQRSVFLHDDPVVDDISRTALNGCETVYVGNQAIAASLTRQGIHRVEPLFCPSLVHGEASRPGIHLLTFGMAHKSQLPYFEKLRDLLGTRSYCLSVSMALHDSRPWELALHEQQEALRSVFGDTVRMLGCLADDALAREIREAHTIALFYEPAVRANNTTLWAALDAGTPVITNLDADSPKELQHEVSVFDINQMTEWPEYDGRRQDIRAGGRKASAAYSWYRLIEQLTAVHA